MLLNMIPFMVAFCFYISGAIAYAANRDWGSASGLQKIFLSICWIALFGQQCGKWTALQPSPYPDDGG
jgi:hypothetical protein